MGYNESNFKNDFNAEKVINEFLRKYFYLNCNMKLNTL